jgi:hypothetical protein
MPAGKRLQAGDPLTEHDVAGRLDKAALRTLRILLSMRQLGLMDEVKHSRYLTDSLSMLAAELKAWAVDPQPGWAGDYPAGPDIEGAI